MKMSLKKHNRYVDLAHHVATWSKDKSKKCGAVIISETDKPLGFGYNGFPPGVNDDIPERHERPTKYKWVIHAEENAIIGAGRDLTNATIYVTDYVCATCAARIIRSGIKRVIIKPPDIDESNYQERWVEEIQIAKDMFAEAKIEYYLIEEKEDKNLSVKRIC